MVWSASKHKSPLSICVKCQSPKKGKKGKGKTDTHRNVIFVSYDSQVIGYNWWVRDAQMVQRLSKREICDHL